MHYLQIKINKEDPWGLPQLPLSLKQAVGWQARPCSLQRHCKRWRPLKGMWRSRDRDTTQISIEDTKLHSSNHTVILFAPQCSPAMILPPASTSGDQTCSTYISGVPSIGWTSGFAPCLLHFTFFTYFSSSGSVSMHIGASYSCLSTKFLMSCLYQLLS